VRGRGGFCERDVREQKSNDVKQEAEFNFLLV